MELHFDVETVSPVDLPKCGAYAYFEHDDTKFRCAAWAVDDGEPQGVLADEDGRIDLSAFFELASRPDAVIFAHNAAFERLAWRELAHKRLGYPPIPDEKWRCTMSMAYAMSLPGALDAVTKALQVEQVKDKVGNRLMLQLCKPTESGGKEATPEKMARLLEYCKNDVRSERAIGKLLRPLPESELVLWRLDQRINDKGVRVDLESVKNVAPILLAEKKRIDDEIARVTNGAVQSVSQTAVLTAYLQTLDPTITSLGKGTVEALQRRTDLLPEVREIIDLRIKGAKASTAKLKAILAGVSADGRVRGMFQYHGASTGRWSGRRIQLHNLPRPNPDRVKPSKDYPALFEAFASKAPVPVRTEYIAMAFGEPLEVVSDCIRGFLEAPAGYTRVDTDFSSIEARLTPWAAGDEPTLEVIRNGQDLYLFEAENIYRLPHGTLDKKDERRQIGKVAVLSLGFGGGVGAFKRMAAAYGVRLDDETIQEVVNGWRYAHAPIAGRRDKKGKLLFTDDGALFGPGIWHQMEATALHALRHPGTRFVCGPKHRRFMFVKTGAHLWLRLQSGRLLCYPFAAIGADEKGRDGVTFYGKSPVPPFHWERVRTWGGTLFQNGVQALARDLLAEAMLKIDAAYPNAIDLHVHDEPGCEIPVDIAEEALHAIEAFMSETPAWASDLPLGAEGRIGTRYRK